MRYGQPQINLKDFMKRRKRIDILTSAKSSVFYFTQTNQYIWSILEDRMENRLRVLVGHTLLDTIWGMIGSYET